MVQHGLADLHADAPRIGQLGRKPLPTFAAYALAALRKLNRNSDSVPIAYRAPLAAFVQQADEAPDDVTQQLNTFAQTHAAGRRQVAAFWTLRALLAPVLERLILEDRVQFLREQGHTVHLMALFDPDISPRNLTLLSIKSV
jgi:hypothetical protein